MPGGVDGEQCAKVERHIRLQADDVADQLPLVPAVIAHLARPVDQVHALHPLIDGEVDLTGEIVDVTDQRADDSPVNSIIRPYYALIFSCSAYTHYEIFS